MWSQGRTNWWTAAGPAVAWLVLVAGAAGQDPGQLAELKQWHDRLASGGAASVDDGQEALAQLKSWALSADKLDAKAREQLYGVEIYASLAVGDAGRAAQRLADLRQEFAGTRSTLRATWTVAVAAGDAQLASQTLERLQEKGLAKADAVSRRQARLRGVGNPAPAVEAKVESGRVVGLRRREGIVLVLDFWNIDSPPSTKDLAALRELHQALAKEAKADMLGINTDAPARLEEARTFARKHEFAWGQHYNAASPDRAVVEQAFGVEATGWHAAIDREGNVRAIGSVSEPEFVYAVRAAVAEARGDFKPLRPKNLEGKEAPSAAENRPSVKPDASKPEAKGAEPEPPHSAEAAALLNQARLYIKAGKKTEAKKILQELIEKYPNTWEAREARRLGLI